MSSVYTYLHAKAKEGDLSDADISFLDTLTATASMVGHSDHHRT